MGESASKPVSLLSELRAGHLALIALSAAAVCGAAFLQYLVTLDFSIAELRVQLFIVPALVGAVFGSLLVRVLIFRSAEKRYVAALEVQQRQIAELNTGLQQRIEERTRELLDKERQLLQAQKMEAVGRLAGGVAHDFNNLLGAILGMTELLRLDLEDNNPAQQSLAEIVLAVDRASKVTRQLLSFSRQQVTRLQAVDLVELVQRMELLLHSVVSESVELRLETEEQPVQVWADPGQLEQILLNLVINGRDAIDGNGVLTVRVVGQAVDADLPRGNRSLALLEIQDSGVGIPPGELARVFEPFYTTKPEHRGTGLGLSVVQGIVEACEGRIEIDSEVGEGTRVRVYVPHSEERRVVDRAEERELVAGNGEWVLIVEDEPLLRRLHQQVLERAGYQARVASSGGEAIAMLRRSAEPIDLVVTDLALPERSGLEVAQILAEERPGTPLVMTSGYGDEQLREALAAMPGLPFLQKPFSPRELLRLIREQLGG